MAMTRQFWTSNGLAAELGRDRRTLGKALRHVPAAAGRKAAKQGLVHRNGAGCSRCQGERL
jgi:hypothetical protein